MGPLVVRSACSVLAARRRSDSRAGGASTRTRSSLSSTSNCPTRAARRRTTTPRVSGWRFSRKRHRRVIHAGRPVQRPHRQGHPGRRRGAVPAYFPARRHQKGPTSAEGILETRRIISTTCYNTKDPPSNHPSFSSPVSSSRRALPFFWRAASTTNPPRARRASQEARRHPQQRPRCPRSLF